MMFSSWVLKVVRRYRHYWRPWMLWLLLIALAVPFLLLLRQGWMWQMATDWAVVRSLVWWLVIGLSVLGLLFVAVVTARKEATDLHPSLSGRSLVALHACLFCALLGWEIAVTIASSRIDAFLNDAFPEANALYTNHDQANLVGKVVRVMLLKVSASETDSSAQQTLEALADYAPVGWLQLINRNDASTQQLIQAATEPKLAYSLLDASQPAISAQGWHTIISGWTTETQGNRLPDAVMQRVSVSLSQLFAVSLREAAKHAWQSNDKAWPAFQIDMASALVDHVKTSLDTRDQIWQQELGGLSTGLSGVEHLLDQLTREQRTHHQVSIDWFKQLSGQLQQLQAGLNNIGKKLDATASEIAKIREFVEAKQAGEDPTKKQLPPELIAKARELLKRGNQEQQALAAIALKQHQTADRIIQTLKKDPLA
ncbi:MAG: hypothetical protein K0U68_04500 [Gammaproteobacteria bacterium]|nr:hypothetical protein [Gammaproteobacteria bacterium]